MLLRIFIFSAIISLVSFLISKRIRSFDRSEIATYVVLIAWCSLMFGLFVSGIDGHGVTAVALR